MMILCIKRDGHLHSCVSGDLGKANPSETSRHWRLAPGLCLNFKLFICVFTCFGERCLLPGYQGILCAAFKAKAQDALGSFFSLVGPHKWHIANAAVDAAAAIVPVRTLGLPQRCLAACDLLLSCCSGTVCYLHLIQPCRCACALN